MQKLEKISLNGVWDLSNSENNISIKSNVPGTVFEALINGEIIEDPFYGNNEHKVDWVYKSEWVYSLEFDIKEEFLKHSNLKLRFYGLDTVSMIYLNGVILGKTDNMFITYEFDVKSILKKKQNKLKIIFKSSIVSVEEKVKEFKKKQILNKIIENDLAHHISVIYGSFIEPFKIFAKINGWKIIN